MDPLLGHKIMQHIIGMRATPHVGGHRDGEDYNTNTDEGLERYGIQAFVGNGMERREKYYGRIVAKPNYIIPSS